MRQESKAGLDEVLTLSVDRHSAASWAKFESGILINPINHVLELNSGL